MENSEGTYSKGFLRTFIQIYLIPEFGQQKFRQHGILYLKAPLKKKWPPKTTEQSEEISGQQTWTNNLISKQNNIHYSFLSIRWHIQKLLLILGMVRMWRVSQWQSINHSTSWHLCYRNTWAYVKVYSRISTAVVYNTDKLEII